MTLFFVETTPAMHKHEYKCQAKAVSVLWVYEDAVGAAKRSDMSRLGCGALLADVQMTQ